LHIFIQKKVAKFFGDPKKSDLTKKVEIKTFKIKVEIKNFKKKVEKNFKIKVEIKNFFNLTS